MKRLIIFAIVITTKTISAMETAKEKLKELAKKAQKPSASVNLRSLTSSIKNLRELELIDDDESKKLGEIVKNISIKWINNNMR